MLDRHQQRPSLLLPSPDRVRENWVSLLLHLETRGHDDYFQATYHPSNMASLRENTAVPPPHNQSIGFAQLPDELLLIIVSHVEKKNDLVTLCRISHNLCRIIQPGLFQDCRVRPRDYRSFLGMVIIHPNLAASVTSLDFDLNMVYEPMDYWVPNRTQPAISTLLADQVLERTLRRCRSGSIDLLHFNTIMLATFSPIDNVNMLHGLSANDGEVILVLLLLSLPNLQSLHIWRNSIEPKKSKSKLLGHFLDSLQNVQGARRPLQCLKELEFTDRDSHYVREDKPPLFVEFSKLVAKSLPSLERCLRRGPGLSVYY